MSHYTLSSGQRQVTVSAYCPICRIRSVTYSQYSQLPAQALCCSDRCTEQHIAALIEAENSVRVQYHLPAYGLYRECYDPYDGMLSQLLEAVTSGDTALLTETLHQYRLHFAYVMSHTGVYHARTDAYSV